MTDTATIASIVEGHGEVQALPLLLRRIAADLFGVHVDVPPPHRVKRNQMTTGDMLSRAARLQVSRVTGRGGVLVVADADKDCAVDLAEQIRSSARPVNVEIAIAVCEFESWFLAGVESLRRHRAVTGNASFPGDPETRRGAKEALGALMTEAYRETLHQPAFAAMVDLRQARRVRSFDHLVSCVGRLVGA